MTKFFVQILKWRTFSSPLKLEGTFQVQGISVNSLHHCTLLTASDKHLEILLVCDSFLLKANNGSLQMYRKYSCYNKIFF